MVQSLNFYFQSLTHVASRLKQSLHHNNENIPLPRAPLPLAPSQFPHPINYIILITTHLALSLMERQVSKNYLA